MNKLRLVHLCRFIIGSLLLGQVMLRCTVDYTDGKLYMLKVEDDNNINKTIEQGELAVSVHYRPVHYLALKELYKQNNNLEDTAGLGMLLSEFEDGVYFDIRFSLKNKDNIILHNVNDRSLYAQRIDYINNEIYNDFYLSDEQLRKIKPVGHTFQNYFGASVNCDLTLVFAKKDIEKSKSIELIYKDRVFGIREEVTIPFSQSDLKNY